MQLDASDTYLGEYPIGPEMEGEVRKTLTLERQSDLLFIAETKPPYIDPFSEPLKSKLNPSEDSLICYDDKGVLITDGERPRSGVSCSAVYPSGDPGFTHGYMYDLEGQEKIIEGPYAEFFRVKDHVFALVNIMNDYDTYLEDEYYTLFLLQGKTILPTDDTEIRFNRDIPYATLFGQSVEVARDSTLLYFEENGKRGLLRFQLFARHLDHDYRPVPELTYTAFQLDTLLAAENDFLRVHGLYSPVVIAGNRAEFDVYMRSSEEEYVKAPRSFRQSFQDIHTESGEHQSIFDTEGFSVSRTDEIRLNPINERILQNRSEELNVFLYEDSLLLTSFYHSPTEFGLPLASEVDPMSDSMICFDVYGEVLKYPYKEEDVSNCVVVYPAPESIFAYAEVIDLKSEKMVLNVKGSELVRTYYGFLYREEEADQGGKISASYNLMQLDGSYLFENIPEADFNQGNGIDWVYRIPKYKADSVIEVGNTLFFYTDGKMGASTVFGDLLESPSDYVNYFPNLNFSIALNDGVVRLRMDEEEMDFPMKKGVKLGVGQYDDPADPYYVIPAFHADLADKTHLIYRSKKEQVIQQAYDYPAKERLRAEVEFFTLDVRSDSLMYIYDYAPDQVFDPMTMEIIDAALNMDSYGDVVEYPGYSRSGLYNFVSKEWVVQPKYERILFQGDEMILIENLRNERGMDTENRYTVKNSSGETLLYQLPYEQLAEKYKKHPFVKN